MSEIFANRNDKYTTLSGLRRGLAQTRRPSLQIASRTTRNITTGIRTKRLWMVTTAHRTSESPLILTRFLVLFPYSPHPDRRHLVPLLATVT